MRKALLATIAVLSAAVVIAQHPARTSFVIPRGGVNDGSVQPDPNVVVRCVERPAQTSTGFQRTKDSLATLYGNRSADRSQNPQVATLPSPVTGMTFSANGFNNGTPSDNEIAIGNNGQLISVQNSNVFRYNTNTSTNLGLQSRCVLFSGLGVTAGK